MSTRIYIGGLSIKVEAKSIEKKFEKYGKIMSVDVKEKKDVDGNVLAKFAYINLAAETTKVLECVNFFNGASWKGTELKVELAKESFLDRLKRERENAKNGLQETSATQQTDSSDWRKNRGDGYSRFNSSNNHDDYYQNKKYSTNDNGYERNEGYGSQYKKNDDYHSNKGNYNNDFKEDVPDGDYKDQKRNIFRNDSEQLSEDDFQSNKRYKDVNGFAQRHLGSNQYGNNEWNQSRNQFSGDISKAIKMIRYDPTKPDDKKLSKVQNTESKTKEIPIKNEDTRSTTKEIPIKNEDTRSTTKEIPIKNKDTRSTTKKKVKIFGKMDFSKSEFKLSDALSKQKKLPQLSNTENNIQVIPKSFFIQPADPRLEAAVIQFTKPMTNGTKAKFEKIKPRLNSENKIPPKIDGTFKQHKSKSKNKK